MHVIRPWYPCNITMVDVWVSKLEHCRILWFLSTPSELTQGPKLDQFHSSTAAWNTNACLKSVFCLRIYVYQRGFRKAYKGNVPSHVIGYIMSGCSCPSNLQCFSVGKRHKTHRQVEVYSELTVTPYRGDNLCSVYRQISNISHTKSQTLNASCLVL